ncbi:hypothetical protein DFJ73DRAFT_779132 [Zopfochytrium polystomum]|nr:hypothetical protein DFJ73DRAFT_779132 [Zopfochytrium polystomum]
MLLEGRDKWAARVLLVHTSAGPAPVVLSTASACKNWKDCTTTPVRWPGCAPVVLGGKGYAAQASEGAVDVRRYSRCAYCAEGVAARAREDPWLCWRCCRPMADAAVRRGKEE